MKFFQYTLGLIALLLSGCISQNLEDKPISKEISTRTLSQTEVQLPEMSPYLSADMPLEIPLIESISKLPVLNPNIDGEWNMTDEYAIFTPKDNFEVGQYYSVTYETSKGEYSHEFTTLASPSIAYISPAIDQKVHESSSVIITFDQPMVALGSVDDAYVQLPIEITPAVKNEWKWLGSRTVELQSPLNPATEYQMKIGAIESITGAETKPQDHIFQTRPLQYLGSGNQQQNFPVEVPISMKFNMPIDIDSLRQSFRLASSDHEMESIPLLLEFQTTTDAEGAEQVNQSIVEVRLNTEDQRWEYDTSYEFEFDHVRPLVGENNYTMMTKVVMRTTSPYVLSWSLKNKQGPLSGMIDPNEPIVMRFSEEVDKDSLMVDGAQIRKTQYAKKCDPDQQEIKNGEKCDMVDDLQRIEIVFQPLGNNTPIDFVIKQIHNTKNQAILLEPRTHSFVTVPEPSVPNFAVEQGQLILCSRTPLAAVSEKEEIQKRIQSQPFIKNMSLPQSVFAGTKKHDHCVDEGYKTILHWNFWPETEHKITFDLVDIFNQSITKTVEFTAPETPNIHRDIYHYQPSYVVTTPQKSQLTYAGYNLESISINVCEIHADALQGLLHEPQKIEDQSLDCLSTQTIEKQLPEAYFENHIFTVDLSDIGDTGHYVLTFTSPKWQRRERLPHPQNDEYTIKPMKTQTLVTVSDIAVIEKRVQAQDARTQEQINGRQTNLYWVKSMQTGEPIEGAEITLHQENDDPIVITTDKEGIAKSVAAVRLIGVIVRSGDDSTVMVQNHSTLRYSNYVRLVDRWWMVTDRPLYKPGDTVEVKLFHREQFDAEFAIPTMENETIVVKDGARQEIYRMPLEFTKYGTASVSIPLSPDARLGGYWVSKVVPPKNEGDDERFLTLGRFGVEEYEGAPFKVSGVFQKEEYTAHEEIALDIQAEYYFGLPVEGGTVKYAVQAQNGHFNVGGKKRFSFGQLWHRCWWGCRYDDTFIARGETEIQSDGTAVVRTKIDWNEVFTEEKRGSKLITITAQVQNPEGKTVSFRKSVMVHAADIYAGIAIDPQWGARAKEDITVKGVTVNTTGDIAKNIPLKFQVEKRTWNQIRRREVDGGWYHVTEEQKETVYEKSLTTNSQGETEVIFSVAETGEYILSFIGEDTHGNTVRTQRTMYIAAPRESMDVGINQTTGVVRKWNDTRLEIVAYEQALEVGDTAKYTIKNPFTEPVQALIAVERSTILDYKIVTLTEPLHTLSLPITDVHLPNVYISVSVLGHGDDPSIKHGKVAYDVDINRRALDITIKTDQEDYEPGDEVVLDISVVDVKKTPVQAEFSLAVVDLSVLALKGNPKKNPLQKMYQRVLHGVSTLSNVKHMLQEAEIKKGKGGDGGEGLDTDIRGDFKDTAHWSAHVETDENGQAQVRFILPDNLTTWQIEALGITMEDTKMGVQYADFITKKSLMITPVLPRFVVPGDQFSAGAKVFNQTEIAQDITITASSPMLDLSPAEQQITLEPDTEQTVWFSVVVPDTTVDNHVITLHAASKDVADGVEVSLPVTANDTYEATAMAGQSNISAQEFLHLRDGVAKKASVEVVTAGSLALYSQPALKSLLRFPHGCTEQMLSKIHALVIAEQAGAYFDVGMVRIDDKDLTPKEAINMALAKIYAREKKDGSYAYYGSMNGDPYLSLRAIQVFQLLMDAGYDIDKARVERAKQYTINTIKQNPERYGRGYIISALHALGTIPETNEMLNTHVFTEDFDIWLREQSSTLSLLLLQQVMISENMKDESVHDEIKTRIKQDARGAYISTGRSRMWQYYESHTRNTAMYIQTLVRMGKGIENPQLANMLRYLIHTRAKDNSWGSTANDIQVVQALVEFLDFSREAESNFELKISLSDEILATQDWSEESLKDQQKIIKEPYTAHGLTPLRFNHSGVGNYYYDILLRYALDAKDVPPRDEGITVQHALYDAEDTERSAAVTRATLGQQLVGVMTIYVPERRNMLAVEAYLPAGLQLINTSFKTEEGIESLNGDKKKQLNIIQFDHKELRRDRFYGFKEQLSPGVYTVEYMARAVVPGEYMHLPARAYEFYRPEIFGRTGGGVFTVTPKK